MKLQMALDEASLDDAREIVSRYMPLFELLEAKKVEYCVVGGLGVMLHALLQEERAFRMTEDADILVPWDYSNEDFAHDYLLAYANSPISSQVVYDVVFSEEGFASLAGDFENFGVTGAEMDLDGIDTPSFDVCRRLNGKELSSIEKERVKVFGMEITVATVPELLDMKRKTLELFNADIGDSSRPQDFIDIKRLEAYDTASAERQGDDSSASCTEPHGVRKLLAKLKGSDNALEDS